MRRFFTTRKLSLLFVIAITGGLLFMRATREGDSVVVEIGEAVTRESFRSFVTASGEIVATRFADVGSSVMGRIVDLAVSEGQSVRAGQTLAQIDPVQARSENDAAAAQIRALEAEQKGASQQVEVSRAELEAAIVRARDASRALERANQLSAAGLLPAAEKDAAAATAETATAQVNAATAALARAEQTLDASARRVGQARAQALRARDVLDKTNITAPIDGIVSRLQVRQGEMVVIGIQNQPGTTLMTISDLSTIDAEVKVAEADVLRLQVGQAATVTLDAVNDRSFSGRVAEIGASALPMQGTGAAAREFRVVVRLEEASLNLRPGLTCDAEILADERTNATTVPLQAVVLRPRAPGGPEVAGVFVARDGRATFTPVTTGIIGGLDVEITGLSPKTAIVIGPFQVLRTLNDGDAIRSADSSRTTR